MAQKIGFVGLSSWLNCKKLVWSNDHSVLLFAKAHTLHCLFRRPPVCSASCSLNHSWDVCDVPQVATVRGIRRLVWSTAATTVWGTEPYGTVVSPRKYPVEWRWCSSLDAKCWIKRSLAHTLSAIKIDVSVCVRATCARDNCTGGSTTSCGLLVRVLAWVT